MQSARFSSLILMKLEFYSTDIRKKVSQIPSTVEAELFKADGRTDRTKLIVAFCNFAKARKNTLLQSEHVICSSIHCCVEMLLRNGVHPNKQHQAKVCG
jgi:hypothetical protein